MEKVRIGNDLKVNFSVYRNGQPESFVGATNMAVEVRNEAYGKVIPSTFSIVDNVVNVVLDAKDCVLCGKHRVTLSYNRGNDITIDALAFELVQFTSLTGGTEIVGVEIVTVNISGDIGIAIPDNNKIDLDGLNSNIRQLKFNTVEPIAPTQAGQMAWSDEEKTSVLHNGLHSHPIGKETFFTAKNLSGALISNGKAVYAIGSTGANATIGLATTADGDIAQRTIGIATMDIPANGFGDITTFGEVNDINTSGLTEGALVYLGLDGNLTSVEPVAPTPNISLGLCIRSHLTQGRIAVYVRPIARINKLTDVHAPNLLDGDVLRWNGTELRYEVYNLVNKADLVAGKVPTSQLPSYVDDVLEYATLAAFPATGETGKIYVALNTNLTYRWSGTAYVEISKSLALGETADTAYRGDRGKTAYDHSQAAGNPHSTTAAQIPNTPAGTIAATTVQGAINELASDIVQVETNLNQTDIKNAEQDASIKSIEQLLSQSNLNQTAQVSSSGREIVSLPKTASNGGMEVKLEGLTAQNLVVNGDFRNGTTGWSGYLSAGISFINNEFKVELPSTAYSGAITLLTKFISENKYYRFADIRQDSATSQNVDLQLGGLLFPFSLASNTQTKHSSIVTHNGTGASLIIAKSSQSSVFNIYVKSVMVINLTATFGAGNEPDLAACDAMFSSYFDGTKSFIPTGRARSVGKNLFDKDKAEFGYYVISTSGNLDQISTHLSSAYIRVQPNTAYTKSINGVALSGTFAFYDASKVFISSISTSTFTTPLNTAYLRFDSPIGNADVIKLEKGSVATPYEPYKETELYLTAPDLKSNGLVKDEIRKGANGYELVKRVGVGTLGAEKVINGGFGTTNSWFMSSDRANITNGTLNIDVTAWGVDVSQYMPFTAGKWYFVKFNVTNVVRGGILNIYGVDNAIPISVNSIKEYTFVMKASTTADSTLKINSANIAISIDNVSVKEITTSDGDLTGTTAVIYDTNIHYTLATPIIAPIEHAGILNSAESGTFYHEPVVADATIYGANISILNTTYPISSLEEIMVHTNVDIYLDVSKAVIASDGLSFTHPDLRAGDLVLFTYFFSKEKVNGLITATYYDGRYVIADTANGKFYKWGVKSTNGVATINLTEV